MTTDTDTAVSIRDRAWDEGWRDASWHIADALETAFGVDVLDLPDHPTPEDFVQAVTRLANAELADAREVATG